YCGSERDAIPSTERELDPALFDVLHQVVSVLSVGTEWSVDMLVRKWLRQLGNRQICQAIEDGCGGSGHSTMASPSGRSSPNKRAIRIAKRPCCAEGGGLITI